jgi:hypothetical protein
MKNDLNYSNCNSMCDPICRSIFSFGKVYDRLNAAEKYSWGLATDCLRSVVNKIIERKDYSIN